jgi:hypothetical protein
MVRYRTDGFPVDESDGVLLVDELNTPGSTDGFVHTGLTNGVTCHYAAFAHDGMPSYSAGVHASATPQPSADFDGDTDVDLADFALFQLCFNGPNRSVAPACAPQDADADGDVDLTDFGWFQSCFNGPNRPEACD